VAFPTIPTAAGNTLLSSTTTTAGTTHTFPSLTTLAPAAGDLLIAVIVQYQGGTANAEFSAWGASFTEILDDATVTALDMAIGVAYKIATGSETGTFTVTSAHSFISTQFLMRIPAGQWTNVPSVLATVRATGAVADPGALNPANWDSEDTLWISVAGFSETTTTGSPPTLDTAPTNYSGALIVARAADAVGNVTAGVAFRQLRAASEDVGTWAVTNAIRGNGSATVIAVRPLPAPTGVGIKHNFDGGTNAVIYSKSGSGILDHVGSGAKPHAQVIFTKTGLAVMGIKPPGNTYAEAGSGIAQLTAASSPDAFLPVETGAGILVRSAAASKSFSPTETGAGISPRSGGGTSFRGSIYQKQNASISDRVAQGGDAFLPVETGAGVLVGAASGTGAKAGTIYTKAGLARMGIALGAFSFKSGSGVTQLTAASSPDVFLPVESGSGVLVRSGGGTETKVGGATYQKTGAGVLVAAASALDAFSPAESGAGVTSRAGTSGPDTNAFSELGTGISSRAGSSGPDANIFSKTGAGISSRAGTSGPDTNTFTESGSGVRDSVASGTETRAGGNVYVKTGMARLGILLGTNYVKAGTGALDRTASGADASIHAETGSGILAEVGTGQSQAGPKTYTKTGAGTLWLSTYLGGAQLGGLLLWDAGGVQPTGAKAVAFGETGSGILPHVGSGAEVKTSPSGNVYQKQNAGIEDHVGSAIDAFSPVETGAGILPHVGAGTEFKGSGATKTGAGIEDHVGSGSDASAFTKSGSGVLDRSASGSETKGAQNVYQKQNIGVLHRVGSGADAFTAAESAPATLSAIGSGSDSFSPSESGSGVLAGSGSGSEGRAGLGAHSGASVRDQSGSGTDASIFSKSGSGVRDSVGSGPDAY